jgi:hypothetical protein
MTKIVGATMWLNLQENYKSYNLVIIVQSNEVIMSQQSVILTLLVGLTFKNTLSLISNALYVDLRLFAWKFAFFRTFEMFD